MTKTESKKQEFKKGEILFYKTSKNEVALDVRLDNETVWLSLDQMATLFERDNSVISRHLKNIFNDNELNKKSVVANFATTANDGKIYNVDYYNLDVVISTGYRVNSKTATHFRIWATKTLKKYIVKGYAINEKRLLETQERFSGLQTVVSFLKDKSQKELLKGQEGEILNLLDIYAKTLSMLEAYDSGSLSDVKGKKTKFVLEYEFCREIIHQVKIELISKKEASELFGNERDGVFAGIIRGLYQTFDGKELYPTIEDKASNLLYFVIKDHPLSDGNKRVASFLFVYFLDKVGYLYKETGEKKINDNALTTLALLISESDPKEKEVMVRLVKNLVS